MGFTENILSINLHFSPFGVLGISFWKLFISSSHFLTLEFLRSLSVLFLIVKFELQLIIIKSLFSILYNDSSTIPKLLKLSMAEVGDGEDGTPLHLKDYEVEPEDNNDDFKDSWTELEESFLDLIKTFGNEMREINQKHKLGKRARNKIEDFYSSSKKNFEVNIKKVILILNGQFYWELSMYNLSLVNLVKSQYP